MDKHKLEIEELTTRELGFISDPDLALVISGLLDEIDRVFSVRGFRSALYLSVSAVEGILKHAIRLNINKAEQASKYPKKEGNPKRVEKLDLFTCIEVCSEISLIPPNLQSTYNALRDFRNYIHPHLELSSKDKINIGIAEMGIGILNQTLLGFDKLRFIRGATWRVISGNPQYSLDNSKLTLNRAKPGTGSFVITDDYCGKDFTLKYDAIIQKDAILNFVYNFESEGSFRMIRIDKRTGSDEGLLECTEKHFWRKKCQFKKSLDPNKYKHSIEISVSGNSLGFKVDGVLLELTSGDWDYDSSKGIGLFNEILLVTIENLNVS